jgi:glyceraldehyde-3-phosphate dehydrogenase/erythrose-4-phosphate dehydrogenase
LPIGKANDIAKIVINIQEKFKNIKIQIKATDGSMTQLNFEMKIMETLHQIIAKLKE